MLSPSARAPIHKLALLKATVGGSLEARSVWFGARRFETLVSAIEASTWLNLAASTLIIVASYGVKCMQLAVCVVSVSLYLYTSLVSSNY